MPLGKRRHRWVYPDRKKLPDFAECERCGMSRRGWGGKLQFMIPGRQVGWTEPRSWVPPCSLVPD